MTEQELKTILQAVLDGKTIQYKRVDLGIPQEFTDFQAYGMATLVQNLLCATNMLFRVKPNTLRYKTRPCYYSVAGNPEKLFRVWSDVVDDESEEDFEKYMSKNTLKFKWLADATEHEVEYE